MVELDLVGLGSAILDFAPADTGVPLSKVRSFVPSAGGAVSNLLVGASRLGLRTGFLGCVGDDEFGSLIIHDFETEGVDISQVKRVEGRATGIAFYSVDEEGERHYLFYRFPGYSDPEATLRPEDMEEEYIAQSKMFHFSESMLRGRCTRGTVFRAVQIARENHVQVCYDPNVRQELWRDRKEFVRTQKRALSFVDVFVSTWDEAARIVGGETAGETSKAILRLGPATVVIRESDGYRVTTHEEQFTVPIFEVKAVDTSGAGDAFDAGFLAGLVKGYGLRRAVTLGGAVAALKVMRAGTRTGLPRLEEALKFLRERTGKDL